MNANRMKYTTTPTYGMQKRGLFKRPEPVYKAPDSPDFSQVADPAEAFQPYRATSQPGFVQPPYPQPANSYGQTPYFPPNLSIPPMQSVGYAPPYAPQGYAPAPQAYAPYMQQPLGNSAPPVNPAAGGARQQGYVPPASQQPAPVVRKAAYLGGAPTQVPLMGGVPLAGVNQPQPAYPQGVAPQGYAPYMPQAAGPAAQPQQPVYPYGAPVGQPVPPAAPKRRAPRALPRLPHIALDADKLWSVFLFIALPALFVPGLFGLAFFRYAFLLLCVVGLGAMWYRQSYTGTVRLVVSVVYVALCIVTIAMMMRGGGDATRQNATPASAPSRQATEAPTEDPALAASTPEPQEPTPTPAGPSMAEQRLSTFMNLWMSKNTSEMVAYVQPTWASAQDNPSSQLFIVLANRTPEAFTIEEISGSDDDNSRTVVMTATINKNNGKDPVIYRFMVVMVKEGGDWYVDPNSLATNDREDVADENVVDNSNVSGLSTLAPRTTVTPVPPGETLLYYNPDGGSFYHADANCPSIRSEYLPLTASFPYSDLQTYLSKGLQPCLRCGAPTQAMSEGE